MDQGKVIVIEGADGAGKATQTKKLVERLQGEGRAVATADFPRYQDNLFGQLIKECLTGARGNFMDLDPKIVSTLYAADRYESKAMLERWLQEDKLVVLDRYVTSNMLHQGAKSANEKDLEELLGWIEKVEYEIFSVPRPDLVIYLDIPAEQRRHLSQMAGKNDLAEKHVAHQAAADEVGRQTAKKFNWVMINCMEGNNLRSIEDIADEVYNQAVQLIQS